jgi:hypothetical protein
MLTHGVTSYKLLFSIVIVVKTSNPVIYTLSCYGEKVRQLDKYTCTYYVHWEHQRGVRTILTETRYEQGQRSRYSDGLRAGRPALDSRQGQKICLYATASRPVLVPTEPPVPRELEVLSLLS